MGSIFDRIAEFLFNGFWGKLDVNHWRKTVLAVFVVGGVILWNQNSKIEGVCDVIADDCVKRAELEKRDTVHKVELDESIKRIEGSIKELSNKLDRTQNLFVDTVKDALKEARKK